METQNAILRASSHSALPSIQIPSRTRSPKLVSSKFHCSFSSRPSLSKANIQCRTKVGKFVCKGVSDFEEDKPKAKHRRKNLAVFVSGGGSNFRSIHEATLSGSVHGDVVLVTNKHVNVHPSLLPAFGGKGFYGIKVHKAVIASGARYSGPTIHFVDEHYDAGRIVAQRVVPVLANDTAEDLATRVLHEEHKLYVDVAAALREDRITWREDGVPLIWSKENPNDYS